MKNLTGQRFDMVVAVKPTEERVKQAVVWECLCDCGNTCHFSTKELRESKFRNCGCEPSAWIKNLRGQIFGMLEVLEITDKRRRHGKNGLPSVVWKCMCHACGNECFISSRTLLINDAKSCGCQKTSRAVIMNKRTKKIRELNQKDREFQSIWNDYKRHAKKKGVEWNLSKEQVLELIKENCHYCGVEPSNGIGSTKYQGIDAIDNSEGYYTENVVPCCKRCNKAKWILPLEEFEDMVRDIYNHYFIKEKRARR
jgi:hypothetical protein